MQGETKHFTVDARTILQLGRDSIRSHITALVELVKNSYDADASIVEVEISICGDTPFIRVADNGFGMTEDVIDDNWLRIGYSEKKIKKRSEKRRKTGEKGIGRIAADRLGKKLKLISKSKNSSIQALRVNWDDFDVDGKNISDIDIQVLNNTELSVPGDKDIGTEIIISDLRQSWNEDALNSLINQLKLLTSPFKKIDNFKINLKTDITRILNNQTITFNDAILNSSNISIEAVVTSYDEKITYELYDRELDKLFLSEIPIKQILSEIILGDEEEPLIPTLELKILFFLRNSNIFDKNAFSKRSDFLKNVNSLIGVKIYRDLISVRPYGFLDTTSWDWLELGDRKAKDPAGVSRKGYKVTPNQIAGAVFIERDQNAKLKDSAGREGLLEEEVEFFILKAIVIKAIELIEAHRHRVETNQLIDKSESKAPIRPSTQGTLNLFSDEFNLISENLKEIGNKVYSNILDLDERREIKTTLDMTAENINSQKQELYERMEEMLDENRVLKGLATLGITNTVFAHETQGALNTTHLSIDNLNRYINKIPDDFKYKEKIKETINSIKNKNKIIEGWGNFSLIRVEIDKRKNPKIQPIHSIIKKAVNEIRSAFLGVNIYIIDNELETIYSKVYPMDLESILFNLLSNAYKACLQSSERKVQINLKREQYQGESGYLISIEDTGKGIAKEFIHKIWEPLFTTKYGVVKNVNGTGLGLTIVQSITNELEGEAKAIMNGKTLGGARFEIWLPEIKD